MMPNGMELGSYERYRSQGFSDEQIAKIWDDTLMVRERMAAKKTKARTEHEVTCTTYERCRKRKHKEVASWLGHK